MERELEVVLRVEGTAVFGKTPGGPQGPLLPAVRMASAPQPA